MTCPPIVVRDRIVAVIILAVAGTIASCTTSQPTVGQDAGAPLDCEQGDLEAGARLSDLAAELSSCDSDADCTQVHYELSCTDTGVHFEGCTFAISKERIDDYEEGRLEVAE